MHGDRAALARRWAMPALIVPLLVTGCSAGTTSTGSSAGSSAGTTGGVTTTVAATATAEATKTVAAPSLKVPDDAIAPGEPVKIGAEGQLTAVQVKSRDGHVLEGKVSDDGSTWTPARRPKTGKTYEVQATVRKNGSDHRLTRSFRTQDVRESNRLTLVMRPSNGATVGVGAPVVIRFDQAVDDRAAVERALVVRADREVTGSWHWVHDKRLHFRPKEYWPANTDVRVLLQLDGVRAGDHLYGGRDYDLSFRIGEKRVAKVDGDKHTMSLTVDGKKVGTWPTSLGKPEFETRNGTYIVLSKDRVRNMTACDANITCDKDHPEWYDVDAKYSVRLTWSGTFVHGAPWSRGVQGEANVSHGCVNLSVANAKTFYNYARFGDIVEVEGTSRDNDDLVRRGDPGMVDWNQDWDDYVAGSALESPVTTQPLN